MLRCILNFFKLEVKVIMTKIKLLFFNVSFKLLCLTGFLYQIIKISIAYFAFKTSTKIELQLQNNFINPSITFCVRYPAILDRTNYEKYGFYPSYRYNTTEMFSDMSKLTIKDIFDLTPDANQVISSCKYRENYYHLDLTSYNKSECYSRLRVTKYQEGGFICYQFRTIIADNKFHCAQAALSHNSYKELYSVLLDQRFSASNAIKLISFIPYWNTSVVSMPSISRSFYVFKLRYADESPKSSKENIFRIWGDVYSITSLPKPYDTNCANDEEAENGNVFCHRKCNIALFKKHGYFPSNEYTTRPLLMKHLNKKALLNETLARDIKSKSQACLTKCNRTYCSYDYSVTNTNTFSHKYNNSITLESTCSNRPAVIMQYLPRITIMELVMYVSSSLGIWFGTSILSINPFNNRRKNGRKRKTRQTIIVHSTGEKLGNLKVQVQSLSIVIEDLKNRLREVEDKLL